MTRLRRYAALLFLPLAFQLVLAAKAIACVGNRSTASAGQMAGMDMPGNQASDSETRQHSDHSKQAPCNRPFGPSDCQPMAACASGALAASQASAIEPRPITHSVIQLVVLAPSSRTTRPELPPPKA